MKLRNIVLVNEMRRFRLSQSVLPAGFFFHTIKGLPDSVYDFAMEFVCDRKEFIKGRFDNFLYSLKVGSLLFFRNFSDDTLIYIYN